MNYKILNTYVVLLLLLSLATQAQTLPTTTTTQNYQLSINPRIPISSETSINAPTLDYDCTVNYLNGIGTPTEVVQPNAAVAVSNKGFVAAQQYDSHYRPFVQYEPYAAATTSNAATFVSETAAATACGAYYPDAFAFTNLLPADNSNPRTQIAYEASPLGRQKAVFKPALPNNTIEFGCGAPTVAQPIRYLYETNDATDAVRRWKCTFDAAGAPVISHFTSGNNTFDIGTLYKKETIDEDNKSVTEFTDKKGRLVLQRVGCSSTDFEDTYYLYDNFGNLSCILTPMAVVKLTSSLGMTSSVADAAYTYKYDSRQRLIEKKVPGKAPEKYVYYKSGQLALRQDGNMVSGQKWEFTKYDDRLRPIMIGIVSSTSSQTTLQTNFDAATTQNETILTTNDVTNAIGYSLNNSSVTGISITATNINTVIYYDKYNNSTNNYTNYLGQPFVMADLFLGVTGIAPATNSTTSTTDITLHNYKGKVTMIKHRVFKPIAPASTATSWIDITGTWNTQLYLYDKFGRNTIAAHYLPTGGRSVSNTVYNFDHTVQASVTYQQITSGNNTSDANKAYVFKTEYTYDDDSRLTKYTITPGTVANGASAIVWLPAQEAVTYEYNEIGQQITKKIHNTNVGTQPYWQVVDYRFNIRNQLSDINNVDDACPPPTFAPEMGDPSQPDDHELRAAADSTDNAQIAWECPPPALPTDSSYQCLISYPFTADTLLAVADQVFLYADDRDHALQALIKRFEGTTITTVQVLQLLQGAINEPRTIRWRWRKHDMAPQNGLDTLNLSRYRIDYLRLQDAVLAYAKQRCAEQKQSTPYETPQLNAHLWQAIDSLSTQNTDSTNTKQLQMPGETNDLFAMRMYYWNFSASEIDNIAVPQNQNGNITAIKWREGTSGTAIPCQRHLYAYQYDQSNRLSNATYRIMGDASTANRFDETMTYNRNGDILSLVRRGATNTTAPFTFGVIDNLTYTYDQGYNIPATPSGGTLSSNSHLLAVEEPSSSSILGFNNQNTGTATLPDYAYDYTQGLSTMGNGNLIQDKNKKLNLLYHSTINQPMEVNSTDAANTNKIQWVYDAVGNKIAMATFSGTTLSSKQYYLDGYEYGSSSSANPMHFRAYYHPEGRVANTALGTSAAVLRYEYTLRDHLGNARVSFSDISTPAGIEYDDRLQTNTYYPYGSTIAPLSSSTPSLIVPNDYKYNNKEYLDDLGLNMLDYGARLYDPLTARWNGVDALAEQYSSVSPYNYVGGNPMSRVDLDGRRTWYFSEDNTYLGRTDDSFPDAVCIVPSNNALHVKGVIEGFDYCTVFGSENNTATYLRDFGISYEIGGLNEVDQKYRGKTKGGKITLNSIPIERITLNGKKYTFVEWSFGFKLSKQPNKIPGSTALNPYGTGAVLSVDWNIKPSSDNAFNWVTPASSSIARGHLHPMPSDFYSFYLEGYTRQEKENPSKPSDGDWGFSRDNPYHNVVIDPINFHFYRPETHSQGRIYDSPTKIPRSHVIVKRSLLK